MPEVIILVLQGRCSLHVIFSFKDIVYPGGIPCKLPLGDHHRGRHSLHQIGGTTNSNLL